MEQFRHGPWMIGLPEGWGDASSVILVGQPQDDFSPNITVTTEPLSEKTSLDDYAAAQGAELKSMLESFEYRLDDEAPMEMAGNQAYRRLHSFVAPGKDFRVGQMQVYVVGEKRAWTITATDRADRFEQSLPILMEAVRRFRFVPSD